MKIGVETRDGIVVVELEGRWDAKSSPEIEAALLPYIQENCYILLDLAGVGYMSSAGLRTLLLLYRSVSACCNCRLVLVQVVERLRDTMEMTGFIQHFELYDTPEEGLAALRRAPS